MSGYNKEKLLFVKPGQNSYNDDICRICLLYDKTVIMYPCGAIIALSGTRVSVTFMLCFVLGRSCSKYGVFRS